MEKEIFDAFLRENDSILSKIAEHACVLHDVECNQKYGDKPYSYHLGKVVDYVYKYGYLVCEYEHHILPIIFGAWFHDAIEDARMTYNDILKLAERFMTHYQAVIATEIVYALTDEKGRNRKERGSEKHYEDIRNTLYAPFVKWCDRMANLMYSIETGSRMVDVYLGELGDFCNKLGRDKYVPKELWKLMFPSGD